jgi:molecular chaperone GrpE
LLEISVLYKLVEFKVRPNMSSEQKLNSDAAMQDSSAENKSASAENSEVETLRALAEKNKNDFLYLRAEFDNYKKHAIKERSDLLKFGYERLAVDLLSVLDNFERALETKVSAENFQTYVKGVELTANELKALLQKFGIQELASEGQPFNPAIHEALSSEPSGFVPEGHVLRVFKKPYQLHGKVIRPGQVVVAKPIASNKD